jgi:ribonuclease VapC
LIVDTSALVAIVYEEDGTEALLAALSAFPSKVVLPAPVILELHRVTSVPGNVPFSVASDLLNRLQSGGAQILAFNQAMAEAAVSANTQFGSGNGKGGVLNLLDLMVYAMAKTLDLPILCTGNDFRATDAEIHPASRIG